MHATISCKDRLSSPALLDDEFGLRFAQAGGRRGEGGGAVRGAHRGGRRARGPPHAADAAQLRRQRCPGIHIYTYAVFLQKENSCFMRGYMVECLAIYA